MNILEPILLASVDGKVELKLLRHAVLPFIPDAILDTQFGSGFNAGSTDVAHLHLTQSIKYAAMRKLCAATIFADVKTAFASLSRAISLPQQDNNDSFTRRLKSFGFTEKQCFSAP